ncbi:hypothetical protein [uncultured Draconibacterium sp.]|uniref:hypothetical protein n=1 Tax=uncultured Draconibacterium sp. TaxID=1573823 RepID=UPI002AA8BBD1|nr:hypothetical protein [uncultured Draconibacterium sp.]
MKTIVLLIFVCCLGFTSLGQNDFAIKPFPRLDFDDFRQQQQPDYLTISPQLKLEDELPQSFFDDNIENLFDNSYLKSTTDVFMALGDNMPVEKPSGNYWNMPVAVPDSTNMYFIKEKRFGGGPSKLP